MSLYGSVWKGGTVLHCGFTYQSGPALHCGPTWEHGNMALGGDMAFFLLTSVLALCVESYEAPATFLHSQYPFGTQNSFSHSVSGGRFW